jgi:hypothetical protein
MVWDCRRCSAGRADGMVSEHRVICYFVLGTDFAFCSEYLPSDSETSSVIGCCLSKYQRLNLWREQIEEGKRHVGKMSSTLVMKFSDVNLGQMSFAMYSRELSNSRGIPSI